MHIAQTKLANFLFTIGFSNSASFFTKEKYCAPQTIIFVSKLSNITYVMTFQQTYAGDVHYSTSKKMNPEDCLLILKKTIMHNFSGDLQEIKKKTRPRTFACAHHKNNHYAVFL